MTGPVKAILFSQKSRIYQRNRVIVDIDKREVRGDGGCLVESMSQFYATVISQQLKPLKKSRFGKFEKTSERDNANGDEDRSRRGSL
jgi:hypothetical protein